MKRNFPFFFLFLVFQFGFSQTERLLQGKVLCDDFPLQGIEIVNLVTEKSTKTDLNGKFSISAKAEDLLVFVSEKYNYQRVFLDREFLDKNNFTFLLTRKPEQLEEVVVISKISFPKIKFDKNIASQLNIAKAAARQKPIGVYDGTIENGIGIYINLPFDRKNIPKIEFKELAKTNYPETFFTNALKLKSEEIGLFLEFCDADHKSKTVLDKTNPLLLMDFLFNKNIEFKEMVSLTKK